MKTTVAKLMADKKLKYGDKFKKGRKTYTYINSSIDYEVEEWTTNDGEHKSVTWTVDLLIAVDEKGKYEVLKGDQEIVL